MQFPLDFFNLILILLLFFIAVIYLSAFFKSRMVFSVLFLREYFQQSQSTLERNENLGHGFIPFFWEQSCSLQLFLKWMVHLSHVASSYAQSISPWPRHDSFPHWCHLHMFAAIYVYVYSGLAIEFARHNSKWKCSSRCLKILQNFKMATTELFKNA